MPVTVRLGGSVPARRLLIALGASLFVHVLVAGGWTGTGTPGAQHPVAASPPPLQAWLGAAPDPVAAPEPVPSLPAGQDVLPVIAAPVLPAPPRIARPAVALAQARVANSGPDPRFYLARELDQ